MIRDLSADIAHDLHALSDANRASLSRRYFKTGKGEYGEGDIFLGVPLPGMRLVAKKYKSVNLQVLQKILRSKIHEYRTVALIILVEQYRKGDLNLKKEIAGFYLNNLGGINNWDLVDISAANILGDYLFDRDRSVLYRLAVSDNLWHRRIAIIATMGFIKRNDYQDTLKIATMLLKDKHDLIHKAAGWAMREVGKKDLKTEEAFLDNYGRIMPRTMLRYAIEKFSDEKRKHYMRK